MAPVKPHQAILEEFLAHLRRVCEMQADWALKVKVSIGAALDFAAAAPEQAKLLTHCPSPDFEESFRVGIEVRDHLVAMLAAGRSQIGSGHHFPV